MSPKNLLTLDKLLFCARISLKVCKLNHSKRRIMKKRDKLRAVWLIGLLLLGLSLTACGGGAAPATEVTPPAAPEAETGTEADTNAPVAEEATEVTEEEPYEAATEEAVEPTAEATEANEEALAQEQLSLNNEVVCEAIEVPDNPLIAEVSAEEWVKGPADAAVTLIEYGDFQ
jgi:hypothetical protein